MLVDPMQKLTGVITESCLDDHEQIEISLSPLKDNYDDSWISRLKLEKGKVDLGVKTCLA